MTQNYPNHSLSSVAETGTEKPKIKLIARFGGVAFLESNHNAQCPGDGCGCLSDCGADNNQSHVKLLCPNECGCLSDCGCLSYCGCDGK